MPALSRPPTIVRGRAPSRGSDTRGKPGLRKITPPYSCACPDAGTSEVHGRYTRGYMRSTWLPSGTCPSAQASGQAATRMPAYAKKVLLRPEAEAPGQPSGQDFPVPAPNTTPCGHRSREQDGRSAAAPTCAVPWAPATPHCPARGPRLPARWQTPGQDAADREGHALGGRLAAGVVQARGLHRRGKVGGAEAGYPHPGAGAGMRASRCRYSHRRVLAGIQPYPGHGTCWRASSSEVFTAHVARIACPIGSSTREVPGAARGPARVCFQALHPPGVAADAHLVEHDRESLRGTDVSGPAELPDRFTDLQGHAYPPRHHMLGAGGARRAAEHTRRRGLRRSGHAAVYGWRLQLRRDGGGHGRAAITSANPPTAGLWHVTGVFTRPSSRQITKASGYTHR